jgi:Cu(I)/Ag(I) efflux system membrane fusion protein
MKTLNKLSRGKWVMMGLGLALLVVLRGPLTDWFSVGSGSGDAAQSSHHDHAGMPMAGMEEGSETSSTEDEVAYYTCPMHASVRQTEPGSCPICNMNLTPVTVKDLQTGDIMVDAVRRQRIGVRTQSVSTRALVRPIRAVGEVTWDESRIHDVTARVNGWVEDIRADRTGDPVRSGATLLRFYSPDLLAGQRELLAAAPGSRLAETAQERLRLWGMSKVAIEELLASGEPQERVAIQSPISGVVVDKRVNEGAHVSAGALLYRLADPRRVWVEADVFEQDLPHVVVGQTVQVAFPHAPSQGREGQVAYVHPSLDSRSRTGRVRIELDNGNGALRPGMLANVRFEVSLGEHLAVPSEAILFTGSRRIVFVDKGEGRLRPVEVQLGARAEDWTIVQSGLSEGDVVVTSGTFLLAAESRIKSATEYWGASDETQ